MEKGRQSYLHGRLTVNTIWTHESESHGWDRIWNRRNHRDQNGSKKIYIDNARSIATSSCRAALVEHANCEYNFVPINIRSCTFGQVPDVDISFRLNQYHKSFPVELQPGFIRLMQLKAWFVL
jgi:hypothetical protein